MYLFIIESAILGNKWGGIGKIKETHKFKTYVK